MSTPTPFEVRWTAAEIEPLLAQVRAYPSPPTPAVADGWDLGCDGGYLRELCAHWTGAYDWRGAMADLNRFPQFTARVEDFDIHFLHVVGEAEGRRPLIVSHGWPGSHYEFWQVIEKLAWPSRFGGAPKDAFDLVVPSLPGYGFSSKPARPIGQRLTARLFDALMTRVLGYDRYLAQGGDWGSLVTSWLAMNHAPHVRAIHLNMMGFGAPRTASPDPAETAWLQRQRGARGKLAAYMRLQMSKPQSLAWLAAGNPVGQAAWIVERFHDWSDLRERPFDAVFPKDRLLTNVMLYVMTGAFPTAAWYYRGLLEEGRGDAGARPALRDPHRLRRLPRRAAQRAAAAERGGAGLQPDPLDRHAPRRPLRRDGGAGPLRGRPPRVGRGPRMRARLAFLHCEAGEEG